MEGQLVAIGGQLQHIAYAIEILQVVIATAGLAITFALTAKWWQS